VIFFLKAHHASEQAVLGFRHVLQISQFLPDRKTRR